MSLTLYATALMMGLAATPHCAAMCGAACAGVTRAGRGTPARSMLAFQAGRLAAYAAGGALAAGAMQTLGWVSLQSAALRPVWTLFHLMVLAWGLTLLLMARQPAWVQRAGLSVWARVRPLVQRPGGVFGAGALWGLMPCGLLYSALLVASLTAGPLQGAVAMLLFAAGSSLGLVAGPVLLARIRSAGNRFRQDLGARLTGVVLIGAAAFALWMDLSHQIAQWCA